MEGFQTVKEIHKHSMKFCKYKVDIVCLYSLKDQKSPKTGSGTDAGEVTAATWQFFEDMHEVLGARPSMDPPVVVASFGPDADPITILMVRFKG